MNLLQPEHGSPARYLVLPDIASPDFRLTVPVPVEVEIDRSEEDECFRCGVAGGDGVFFYGYGTSVWDALIDLGDTLISVLVDPDDGRPKSKALERRGAERVC